MDQVGLFPRLDSSETFYRRLIGNEPVKQFPDDRLIFQQTFPLLFDIVSIMEGDQLPETLTAVIIDLLKKQSLSSAEMDQYQKLCNWMYTTQMM